MEDLKVVLQEMQSLLDNAEGISNELDNKGNFEFQIGCMDYCAKIIITKG